MRRREGVFGKKKGSAALPILPLMRGLVVLWARAAYARHRHKRPSLSRAVTKPFLLVVVDTVGREQAQPSITPLVIMPSTTVIVEVTAHGLEK